MTKHPEHQFYEGEKHELTSTALCKFCNKPIAWMRHQETGKSHPHDFIWDEENNRPARTTDGRRMPIIGNSHTITCEARKKPNLLGTNAKKREELILKWIANNASDSTYSTDIENAMKEDADFLDACHYKEVNFDHIRVAILDLQKTGYLEIDKSNGWNLTKAGYDLLTTITGIPF